MKKNLLSYILVLMSLVMAVDASAEFRYGPTAGATMSTLRFKQDNIWTAKSMYGFSAGVMGEMMFPGIGFGIDIGLQYDMRGAKLNIGEFPMWADEYPAEQAVRLHYVNLPIHLRYKYTNLNGFEDTLAPFVYAGPSVGFLVGHNKVDCLDYAGGELGVDFGIGVELMRHWQVSFNYNWGLTYAMKAKVLTNYSARNSTFGLRLTYLF